MLAKSKRRMSTVNYKNLIQDLADMYSYSVDEVVLVECVANSLDAKSPNIFIEYEPKRKKLIITDNGHGMTKSQFEQYHDFAVGLKTRGKGIGFAGVGAKISFNIASQVITETRSNSFQGASFWNFDSDGQLGWDPREVKSLKGNGTRVEISFNRKANIKYSNEEDIKNILLTHYTALFDEKFLEFYKNTGCYLKPPIFIINNKKIKPIKTADKYQMQDCEKFLLKTRGKHAKPIGYCFFGLVPETIKIKDPGITLSTWGKVIKHDFLNQFPGELMIRIYGIAEIPNFVHFLTTSKSDFNIRKNPKEFSTYYSPLRDKFASWLKKHGVDRKEESMESESIQLEEEISRIITSLPEISDLLIRRSAKRVSVLDSEAEELASPVEGSITFPIGEGTKGKTNGIAEINQKGKDQALEPKKEGTEKAESVSRKGKFGPKVAFIDVPEREEMGWLDGDVIYINIGHPGYKKTSINKKSRHLFNIVSIATSLQRYLGEDDSQLNRYFVDKFLHVWGKK